MLIRDNVLIQRRKRQRQRYRKLHIGLDTQKNYNIVFKNDITLLVGRRESNDINLVLYADPAGTGTYKDL